MSIYPRGKKKIISLWKEFVVKKTAFTQWARFPGNI